MIAAGRAELARGLLGGCVTLAMTVLLLAPAFGPGHLLHRDFITVPSPSLTSRTWGWDGSPPRAVPLDAVTALLAPVLPTGMQQQIMLAASLVLSGCGVAWLLRRRGSAEVVVGAALATWSPYAAERLLLGQPPTLLAWSVLPWVLVAVRAKTRGWRWVGVVVLAALPATLTPFGGLTVASFAILAAWHMGRPSADLMRLAVSALLWCLPWLVPAIRGSHGAGDPDGARAFGVSVTGVDELVDILGGGGVWAAAADLPSRAGWPALTASGVLVMLAGLGVAALGHHRVPAMTALLGPPALVAALATAPGLALVTAAQSVPGVALFRDTHRVLGLSAFALSLLAPVGLGRLIRSPMGKGGALSVLAASGAAVGGVALAVLAASDAPRLLHQAYTRVTFVPSWESVVDTVGDGHALVLPWQPLRQTSWARGQVFLDPLPLALRGPSTSARDLTVRRGEAELVVGQADPAEASDWRNGQVDAASLARLGITHVVQWRDTPGVALQPTDGLLPVLTTREFQVWHVVDTARRSG